MLRLVSALILALRPHIQVSELRRMSTEISRAAQSRNDAELLVAVHLHETGFILRPRYPFGLTCCMRRVHRVGDAARMSLRILHTGIRRCHSLEGGLRYYNSGVCRPAPGPSQYARDVVHTVRRLHSVNSRRF